MIRRNRTFPRMLVIAAMLAGIGLVTAAHLRHAPDRVPSRTRSHRLVKRLPVCREPPIEDPPVCLQPGIVLC
jgi:hypothetical protein